MTRSTFLAHRATVALMAAVVLVATGDGFAQSYAGLFRWAVEHHLTGWKAASFPLLVDLFIAVGELGLFALALEGHRLGKSGLAWADLALPFGIASAGWGVSLVFNIGAVGHRFADQATAAVPPVASMLGLLVLLRTLHRLVTHPSGVVVATGGAAGHQAVELVADDPSVTTARDRFCDVLSTGSIPSVRAIRREMRVGYPRAVRIREALKTAATDDGTA